MNAYRNAEAALRPKSKLVIFAPYPPAKSGIADYVAELMPYHCAEFDVTLVIADDAPLPVDGGHRILLASEFERHREHFSSALKLYHIGNNPHHCYMLDFLARDPGVVVLHDFNLCYLHEMATLKWGNPQLYLSSMEHEYGALGQDILSWQLRHGYRESFAGYELPLNGNVLENATAVITHSRQVQYRVAARAPRKPVWYVPHHLSPRAMDYLTLTRENARNKLGLPQNEIVVTAVGFVTRAKQIPMALAALSSLREKVGRFRFILAGERRPDEYDVDADIASSGLSGLVTCTDYLDEEHFFQHLAAADIVINLRYPSGGEMSGTLVRALGLGVPTIVLDHGPMGEFPDSVVKKVDWGKTTQTALAQSLQELMSDPDKRRALGARGAAYVRREHDIVAVSERYGRALRTAPPKAGSASWKTHFPSPAAAARKVRQMGNDGRALLGQSDGGVWWSVPAIPVGGENAGAALIISAQWQGARSLLVELFGWKPETVSGMTLDEFLDSQVRGPDDCPLPAGHYALALVLAPSHLKEPSAAFLMRRLNCAMRPGGSVCVETWADAAVDDDPDRAFLGRPQLAQRLRDAGFGTIREWTAQDGLIPELLRDLPEKKDERKFSCVSGRKVSDYAVWRFADSPNGLPRRIGGRVGSGINT